LQIASQNKISLGPQRHHFALLSFQFGSKLTPVEYKGLRYTIRTRIEREQWSVAIHPAGLEMKGRVVIGSRSDAELQARAMINDWLKKHSTQKLNSN
jgi:hypothetical protein